MEASPTLKQPRRLSCLRKPPQRLEMFSTTRPWGTQGHSAMRGATADQQWRTAHTKEYWPSTEPQAAWRYSTSRFTHTVIFFLLFWEQASPLCRSESWTSRSFASCFRLEPGRSMPEMGGETTERRKGKWKYLFKKMWKKMQSLINIAQFLLYLKKNLWKSENK